jgi:hypothetical protein
MLMLTIIGLVTVSFSFLPTTAIAFTGIQEDRNSSSGNSSALNNSSTANTTQKNQTLEFESVLGHLERARNAIGADAAEEALAEIDAAEKELIGSIQNTTNIISNITDPN